MNIYETTTKKVCNGAKYRVDFKKRTLRVNGKNVKLEGELGIPQFTDLDQWLDKVEDLYDEFKYSKPTATSMNHERRAYFKGLSVPQLVRECGHNALSNPLERNEAQARLELFILLSLVNGSFKPEELFAKDWFFQGTDKDFVLHKDWF